MRNVQEIFVGYTDGDRASAKYKQRRDNNIKMDLKETGPRLCDLEQ